MAKQINTTGVAAKEHQRMFEIGSEEMWTDFHEKINQFMLEEKQARQDNDSFKGAELCCKIVSGAK